ncbi:MAG: hypothetical protein ABI870_12655 [Rhodanobacter sp.]
MTRHRLPGMPSMDDHFAPKWTLLHGYFACTLEARFGMEFCMSIKMDPVVWSAFLLLSSATASAQSFDHAESFTESHAATCCSDPLHLFDARHIESVRARLFSGATAVGVFEKRIGPLRSGYLGPSFEKRPFSTIFPAHAC